MAIGLTGSHRSGKTTLALEFAKKNGFTFVKTSAGEIFSEMGLTPSVTYDFSTRLAVQNRILDEFDKTWAQYALDSVITDRTPLDLLAYTLAEVVGDNINAEQQDQLDSYIRRCFDVANKRFHTIILIQPGIALVQEEGKAALNRGYIEHLNSLILGLSVDERLRVSHFYLPRHMTNLEARIGAVEFALGRVIKRVASDLQDCYVH